MAEKRKNNVDHVTPEKQVDSDTLTSMKVSQEEQEEILQKIEDSVKTTDFSSLFEQLKPETKKTGLKIPLIVAGSLFALSAVIIVLTQQIFGQGKETSIIESNNEFLSIESQLVRQIVSQSEQTLLAKEREIGTIRTELEETKTAVLNLGAGLDRNVDIKRVELEDQLDEELEKRKQVLEENNISTEEIENQLAEYREQGMQAIEIELEGYRIDLETEITQQREGLQSRIEVLTSSLNDKQAEFQLLDLEIEQRRDELVQLTAENASISDLTNQLKQLTQEASQSEQQYENLLQTQQRSALVMDQVQDEYYAIIGAYRAKDYAESKKHLNVLTRLLGQIEPTNQLLVERVSLDRDITTILRELINSREREEAEIARRLEEVRALTDKLNDSQESIQESELQNTQISNLQQNIAVLTGDLTERDEALREIQEQLTTTINQLAVARQELADRSAIVLPDPSQDTNTLVQAREDYQKALADIKDIERRNEEDAENRAYEVLISSVSNTGIFKDFFPTITRLNEQMIERANEEAADALTERVTASVTRRVTASVSRRVTADVTKKVTEDVTEKVTAAIRRAYNTSLAQAVRYLDGDTTLRSTLARVYAQDKQFESSINKLSDLLTSAARTPTETVAPIQELDPDEEIIVGYIARLSGKNETSIKILNPGSSKLSSIISIYRVQKSKRTLLARGTINRTGGDEQTAQINRRFNEDSLEVQKNDLVYTTIK